MVARGDRQGARGETDALVRNGGIQMTRSRTLRKSFRIGGFLGAAALTATLAGVGVAGTGAYFTDSEAGSVTGTMGSIQVSSTSDLNLKFANLLPGEAQSKTIVYTNDGVSNQDVWVVFAQADLGDFNHLTDTGLINDRGTYAEIHIKANGTGVFASANLNDDPISCPSCTPLPKQILLTSNLAPTVTGNMEFSYTAGAKYKKNQAMPEINLPYKIVATQHGIAPDNALN
jgi:hypothetical protein